MLRERPIMLSLLICGAILGAGLAISFWDKRDRDESGGAGMRWAETAADRGLDVRHEPGPVGGYFFPEIMAGGAAFLDYDRDGDLDVYLVQGHDRQIPVADREGNRLFRQEEDGTFTDVSAESGLDDRGYGMGVAVGDVNNDGFPDVYVTNFGPDALYLNQQDGTFQDVTEQAGLGDPRWGASACFLDYDRDGWLDLFVTNYVDYFPDHDCGSADGRPDYCSPSEFDATADSLYRNRGGLRPALAVEFEDVSIASGIAAQSGPGLGVVAADFNNDGWQDLYIANDGAANFLWMNGQDGTFAEQAVVLGCAYDPLGRPQAGMGIAVGDLNDDLIPDLLVTHLAAERNAVYLSDPESSGFQESSVPLGLGEPSYPYTGFGAALADFDHDGWEEAIVVNGRVTRPEFTSVSETDDLLTQYAESDLIWSREGDDFQLIDDPILSTPGVSRALCVGDADNDGDLDLLTTAVGGPLRLLENRGANGHWLSLRAVQAELGGRDAYGARITVRSGDRQWTRWVGSDGSYLSSSDPRVHVGLGDATRVDSISVRWPDGVDERFAVEGVDRFVELTRGRGEDP